jgi:outer membrane PBP1 activator LpoA protein
MPSISIKGLLAGFALLLLINGCSMDLSRSSRETSSSVDPSGVTTEADRSRLRFQGQTLLDRASNSPPPLRDQLYLEAAQAFLRGEDYQNASNAAAEVNTARLGDEELFNWSILSAEIKLKRSEPTQALKDLISLDMAGRSTGQQERYYQVLVDAQQMSGNYLESAKARTQLDPLLKTPEAQRTNQLALLRSLTQLSDSSLDLLQPSPPGVLGGWMELARIAKRHGNDLGAARDDIQGWRQKFPAHPATRGILEQGLEQGLNQSMARSQAQYQSLEQIAVLLPLSGTLKDPATAIRNGIMAAHSVQPAQQRASLKFYDSSNVKALDAIYQQALDEGAVAVIGPLEKEGTALLIRRGDLPVPTLALNRVDSDSRPPGNLFQFALAPEDEAEQVAERAWQDDHRRALMMIPDSAWGQRTADAFVKRWQQLGGTLVEQQVYKEKEHDFSLPIRKLLKIGTSVSQVKAQQRKGGAAQSQPQRRSDADFLFLAASPEKAREIRPQLQFNFAGDLPLYATARIYEGTPNNRLDRDLNGIRFPDQPWLLINDQGSLSRDAVAKLFPASRNRLPRLHAMGIDAYQLVFRLRSMTGDTGRSFPGKTGTLQLDHKHHIHAQLTWAQMTNGVPKLLGNSQAASANAFGQ